MGFLHLGWHGYVLVMPRLEGVLDSALSTLPKLEHRFRWSDSIQDWALQKEVVSRLAGSDTVTVILVVFQ